MRTYCRFGELAYLLAGKFHDFTHDMFLSNNPDCVIHFPDSMDNIPIHLWSEFIVVGRAVYTPTILVGEFVWPYEHGVGLICQDWREDDGISPYALDYECTIISKNEVRLFFTHLPKAEMGGIIPYPGSGTIMNVPREGIFFSRSEDTRFPIRKKEVERTVGKKRSRYTSRRSKVDEYIYPISAGRNDGMYFVLYEDGVIGHVTSHRGAILDMKSIIYSKPDCEDMRGYCVLDDDIYVLDAMTLRRYCRHDYTTLKCELDGVIGFNFLEMLNKPSPGKR